MLMAAMDIAPFCYQCLQMPSGSAVTLTRGRGSA
jgi:hypothetical protein